MRRRLARGAPARQEHVTGPLVGRRPGGGWPARRPTQRRRPGAAQSTEFAARWDAHDVEYYRSGRQRFHHPDVGDLDLDYDALEIPAAPGLTVVTYTLAATSPHASAFARLHEQAASL
ncbi:hypothetical protein AB0N17_39665 [Streptomyces sp. NPDC051133]|uniref:MmyB family transcriptional regulator n=1 Tax=Streptomyces sp. NPDC051133 TaxID=3155521 RepID=UPI00343F37A9